MFKEYNKQEEKEVLLESLRLLDKYFKENSNGLIEKEMNDMFSKYKRSIMKITK